MENENKEVTACKNLLGYMNSELTIALDLPNSTDEEQQRLDERATVFYDQPFVIGFGNRMIVLANGADTFEAVQKALNEIIEQYE